MGWFYQSGVSLLRVIAGCRSKCCSDYLPAMPSGCLCLFCAVLDALKHQQFREGQRCIITRPACVIHDMQQSLAMSLC